MRHVWHIYRVDGNGKGGEEGPLPRSPDAGRLTERVGIGALKRTMFPRSRLNCSSRAKSSSEMLCCPGGAGGAPATLSPLESNQPAGLSPNHGGKSGCPAAPCSHSSTGCNIPPCPQNEGKDGWGMGGEIVVERKNKKKRYIRRHFY